VQSYGIHSYILEQGVGGAFCGLFIGERSIEWQPDTLFLLYDRARDENINMVSSIVRDHVFVVRSTFDEHTGYFFNTISCASVDDWIAKWLIPAHTFLNDGRFDFIVLVSRRFRIITVIEMFKHRSNQFLSITPLASERALGQIGLELEFSPQLSQIMDDLGPNADDGGIPGVFNWYPYCRNCRAWTPYTMRPEKPAACDHCHTSL
jgi:hypothetical protein